MGAMRVGFVTTFYSKVGGISTFVRNVVKHSRIDGNIPFIFSPDKPSSIEDENYIVLCQGGRLKLILSLIRQLEKYQIYHIQCHGTWYLLLACIIYKRVMGLFAREVRVITVKHSDIETPIMIKRCILQAIDNQSDGVVFVSKYLKEKYEKEFNFHYKVATEVVNPGCGEIVARQQEVARLSSLLDIHFRRPLLTYIGLFEYPGKVRGLVVLLEALALISSKLPDVFLAIAGRGSLKNEVEAAIERLSLQSYVMILDSVDNPYALLQLSDLHCHISLQDNFALVVLEALSTGTPVVASAVGELPNIDLEGLVIVDAEPEAIAATICNCIASPPKVNVDDIHKLYNWNVTATKLNRIILGV